MATVAVTSQTLASAVAAMLAVRPGLPIVAVHLSSLPRFSLSAVRVILISSSVVAHSVSLLSETMVIDVRVGFTKSKFLSEGEFGKEFPFWSRTRSWKAMPSTSPGHPGVSTNSA